jgi:hypothetical protein
MRGTTTMVMFEKEITNGCVAYFITLGIPQVEAEVQYIELVERLKPLYE